MNLRWGCATHADSQCKAIRGGGGENEMILLKMEKPRVTKNQHAVQ